MKHTRRPPNTTGRLITHDEVDFLDEISITIAFALLALTWLTLRGMDGRARRRTRR